jgi:hypothetical protein
MRPFLASLALAGALSAAGCGSPADARPRHQEARVVAHPRACPARLYCGCGVSVRVFGRPIRSLFLAANWRRFPPADLGRELRAPGDVAHSGRLRRRSVLAVKSGV